MIWTGLINTGRRCCHRGCRRPGNEAAAPGVTWLVCGRGESLGLATVLSVTLSGGVSTVAQVRKLPSPHLPLPGCLRAVTSRETSPV